MIERRVSIGSKIASGAVCTFFSAYFFWVATIDHVIFIVEDNVRFTVIFININPLAAIFVGVATYVVGMTVLISGAYESLKA